MHNQTLYDYTSFGQVQLRCIKVVNRSVHGRHRRVKILLNPYVGYKIFGYHDFDGTFVRVDPSPLGLY